MAIARIQGKISADTAGAPQTSPITVTLTSAVSSGNMICGFVTYATGTITGITDDKGNVYTIGATQTDGTDTRSCTQFCLGMITNAPQTISVALSGTVTWCRIIVDEFSGCAAGYKFSDGTQGTCGAGTDGASAGTPLAQYPNGLMYCCIWTLLHVPTIGTGFSAGTAAAGGDTMNTLASEWIVSSGSATSQQGTWTVGFAENVIVTGQTVMPFPIGLVFIEGFESGDFNGTPPDNLGWIVDGAPTVQTGVVNSGTYAAKFGLVAASNQGIASDIKGATFSLNEVWARFYWRYTALPAAQVSVVWMIGAADFGLVVQGHLQTDGSFEYATRGTSTLGNSGVLAANTWHLIEVHVIRGNPGTIQIKINGTMNLNDSTQNTDYGVLWKLLYHANVAADDTPFMYLDDIAVSDTAWVGPIGGGGSGSLIFSQLAIPLVVNARVSANIHT